MLFSFFVIPIIIASGSEEGFKGMHWSNCLKPPFNEVNEVTGTKRITGWVHGGSTQIKQNFIRLTPDKPSKTGWMFNTAAAPKEDFTLLLRFRISGASESLSGDGMAFWYTSTNTFNHGLLMGSTDAFVGVGVLFDTFANDELHRDIVIVASNGKHIVDLSHESNRYPGCESKFRRWEGREDFTIEQETIAKITLVQNKIMVEIDSKGSGEFILCAEKDLSRLLPEKNSKESNWRSNAHFAFSATTGALHDNHDILEVITTAAEHFDRLMELHDEFAETPNVLVKTEEQNVTAEEVGLHVNNLAYEVKDIDERLQKLHHEIEHEVEKVAHRLEALIETLTKQEQTLERRIGEIDQKLSMDLYTKMDSRLQNLEQQIYQTIEGRQQAVHKQIGATFDASIQEARTWKWPFIILVLILFPFLGYLGYTVFRINKKVAKDQTRYFD
jgi:mannose-binding lectin 2